MGLLIDYSNYLKLGAVVSLGFSAALENDTDLR